MGGVNLMMHGAGWMEGGLTPGSRRSSWMPSCSRWSAAFLDAAWEVDDDELAIAGDGGRSARAVTSSAPAHPVALPDRLPQADALGLAELRVVERGGLAEVPSKANRTSKELLAAYTPPPMDAAIREELDAFVARRKVEGGVPTDY